MPNGGLHHLHKRKRQTKKLEPYPHPEPLKRFLDHIIYAVCILTPMIVLPQVWKIWSEQNASGISLITYVGLIIANLIWVFYGVVHKEKPIILLYFFFFLVNSAIALGRILYG